MACIALFARASGRRYDALRALCFVLLILLLWNPLSLAYDPGFELSFVATLGLILGTPLIEPRLAFLRYETLREITATTIAAQIAVLPLLLWQTGNLSLVSVPANVLVSLVIPLAMGLSFIAGLVGIILPVIATLAGIPAYLLLSYIIAVAEFSASLPLAHVILPSFSICFVALAYTGLVYIAFRKRSSMTDQLRLSKKASM